MSLVVRHLAELKVYNNDCPRRSIKWSGDVHGDDSLTAAPTRRIMLLKQSGLEAMYGPTGCSYTGAGKVKLHVELNIALFGYLRPL